MTSISERILYIRNRLKLTQSMFAEQLRITKSYISHIENGKREPSDVIVSAICNEFGVSELWLRSGEGEPFIKASSLTEYIAKRYSSNPYIQKILSDGVADPSIRAFLASGVKLSNKYDVLTAEEQRLLDLFRSLDERTQKIVLDLINSTIKLSKEREK